MLMNSMEYLCSLENLKQEIRQAQYRAAAHANAEMLMLYYDIGCMINEHKAWSNKLIDNLVADINMVFPDSRGYSVRKMKYMAKFADAYADREFVQQFAAQIPWGHNVVLLDRISDGTEREWYIRKSLENGWSRNVLLHQIESGLYQRQLAANRRSSFKERQPSHQSELSLQIMNDPYVLDFLSSREAFAERELEKSLAINVTNLLLEVKEGFAFLGSEYTSECGRR